MAGQTLSNFDAILKNAYRGPIIELLNQETYLIDQFEKTDVNNIGSFTGRYVIFPVHTGRNPGRGGVSDGGQLATAGHQSYQDAQVSMKQYNGAIEVTQMVIDQSATDEGAFDRALNSEMDRSVTDLRKTMSRILYGTGDGVLANVVSSTTSTIITVDSGQYIAVGDVVDVLTKTNGTSKTTGATVSAVTYNGTAASSTQTQATITLSASAVVTSADSVYLSGDRSLEGDGLRNITNTSRILHNIDSSSVSQWDGNVKDASNANPTEDLFMQLAQTIRQKSGKSIDSFLTTYGVQRRLAAQYASQKRWNDGHVVDIDGGYSAIMIASGSKAVPVIADVDCPGGYAFALNKSVFAWAEVRKPDWLSAPTGNGNILFLKDGTTAGTKLSVWQGWYYWPACLVCTNPRTNGQVKNLNDDIPIVRE